MKVCFVGQLKPKFIIEVDTEADEVIEVKWRILMLLGYVSTEDKQVNHQNAHF